MTFYPESVDFLGFSKPHPPALFKIMSSWRDKRKASQQNLYTRSTDAGQAQRRRVPQIIAPLAPMRRGSRASGCPTLSLSTKGFSGGPSPSVRKKRKNTTTTAVSTSVPSIPLTFKATSRIKVAPSSDWLEVHRPKTLRMVVGKEKEIHKLQAWLREFSENPLPKTPMALLHGRPGTGKTTVARLLLKSFGYEIVEVNASDTRTYKGIKKYLDRVCLGKCVTGKSALLLEEIDGTFESETGKSSISAISDFLAEHKDARFKAPIICTCNETYKGDIKSLYRLSLVVPFWQLYPKYLTTVAQRITQHYQMTVSVSQMRSVVHQADGDARQVIQSLRMLYHGKGSELGSKDSGSNIFQLVGELLRGKRDSSDSTSIYSNCGSYGVGLIFENYPAVVDWNSYGPFAAPTTVDPKDKAARYRQADCMDEIAELSESMATFDIGDTFDRKNPGHGVYFAHDYAVGAGVQFVAAVNTKKNFRLTKCGGDFFKRPQKDFNVNKCFIEEIDPVYFDRPLCERVPEERNAE